MKRTIKSIQASEVVWCKSSEEAKKFSMLANLLGLTLADNDNYGVYTELFLGKLCYNVKAGQVGERENYQKKGYTITPATEFIEDIIDSILTPDHLEIYKQGQEARKEGMPKSDNPYVGVLDDAEKTWSDGYESVDNLVKISPIQVKSVPYQVCPMCHGRKLEIKDVGYEKNVQFVMEKGSYHNM